MDDQKNSEKARYRTKQINIIKTKGNISAHSTIECDYYLVINKEKNKALVRLDDSVYRFNTKGSKSLEDFVKTSDKIKNEIIYALNSDGSIKDLLNHEDIQQRWMDFKQNITEYEFLKEATEEAIEQIIKAGDMEYTSKDLLLKNSNTNLFNKIIFAQYLTRSDNEFEMEEFETISHFFPQINFTVSCDTKQVKDLIDQVKYQKKGKPVFVDVDMMIRLYEQFYKEQIGFRFTDYLYDFEMNFTVSKKDGLINYASVNIDERIKNNLESQVIYELKRVEL